MRSLVVISAGLSTPSSTTNVSDTIARAVSAAITARGESLEIHSIELSELIPDLSTALSTGVGTPRLEEVKQKLSSADALVAVSPVFKASYSGLFKTFLMFLMRKLSSICRYLSVLLQALHGILWFSTSPCVPCLPICAR